MSENARIIKINGEEVEVSEELYLEHCRYIGRIHSKALYHHRCKAPDWRLCHGDCALCAFRCEGDEVSLEKEEEAGRAAAHGGSGSRETEDLILKKETARIVREVYQSLSPVEQAICDQVLYELPERQAAKQMGISLHGYQKRKQKCFARLRLELKKIL